MKNALAIVKFLSYSSNTEVSKVSSWGNVKPEALNGLNRTIRVLWNSKEWNFRREIKKTMLAPGKSTIAMSNYIIAQNGIRIDGVPLVFDKNIPFYDNASNGGNNKIGKPEKYYINNKDKIILYPVPDKKYNLMIETFNLHPIVARDGTLKTVISDEDDTLNLPQRLEDLFIDCLNYFCNEILNGDITDEEYQEHALRYSEVYKLLEKADKASLDNDSEKGFLMPWQLLD